MNRQPGSAKLNAATASADRGNIGAVVNQVEALIQEVEGLVNGGVLTMEQGQALIECAQNAISQLEG